METTQPFAMIANVVYQFALACLIAIPIACASWTVANEEVFREFREQLDKINKDTRRHPLVRKLAYLPTCHYCFSHWVTFIALLLTRFHLVVHGVGGYVLAFFALPLIANVYLTEYNIRRLQLKRLRCETDNFQKGEFVK